MHEGSWLDLLHSIMVQMQLLQGGQPIKGLLQRSGQIVQKKSPIFLSIPCPYLVKDFNFIVSQVEVLHTAQGPEGTLFHPINVAML